MQCTKAKGLSGKSEILTYFHRAMLAGQQAARLTCVCVLSARITTCATLGFLPLECQSPTSALQARGLSTSLMTVSTKSLNIKYGLEKDNYFWGRVIFRLLLLLVVVEV